MLIKGIEVEDFVNYKKPAMFISTGTCNWKCCTEAGIPTDVCQNSSLAQLPFTEVEDDILINLYMENPITEAIVFGGLEPFEFFGDLYSFISDFRDYSDDDVVIYTGFNKDEIIDMVKLLSLYDNIIIKFGRFVPDQEKHYDEVLGVELASDNQYAEKIS